MSSAEDLADAVVSFVRCFGLHRPEQTSCGFDAGVAEAHALIELEHGPLRQMELVDLLGLAKSTVSRVVSVMVERGWVARESSESDGRGVTLSLTDDGRDAANRLSRARALRMQALLDQVPPSQRDEVVEVLRVLQDAAHATDMGRR
ncbi:MAG: MarR family transcriptional regulator [Acidimicrobiia bacterium]